MKLLFSIRSFWSVKVYESAIRMLAERGHDVALVATSVANVQRKQEWAAAARRLADEFPSVTCEELPKYSDPLQRFGRELRYGLDSLRYLEPEYAATPRLRARALPQTPAIVRRLSEARGLRTRAGRRLLRSVLGAIEHAIPESLTAGELLERHRPDIVLLSPLITLGSPQADILKAARRMGLRTALAVGSWDHLSSKALIRPVPDRVLVWNNIQRREAVEMHGVSESRVVATGAQCFDQWFGRRPRRTRDEFLQAVGLDPGRPMIAYVCSSLFAGSPPEARFVERWVDAVRGSRDVALRDANIIVRPHPNRGDEWRDSTLLSAERVAVWPPAGAAPMDDSSKDDYFETLFYSEAVVGLNTSAMIEAAIIGRPVYTVLLPEFQDNQEGTVHFHYLRTVGGGILETSRSLEEHVEQLASLRHNATSHDAFLRDFVRPRGLDAPATPAFVDALERLAAEPPRQPDRVLRSAYALRPWLAALAKRASKKPAARRARN